MRPSRSGIRLVGAHGPHSEPGNLGPSVGSPCGRLRPSRADHQRCGDARWATTKPGGCCSRPGTGLGSALIADRVIGP